MITRIFRDLLAYTISVPVIVAVFLFSIMLVEASKGQTVKLDSNDQILVCQPMSLWESLRNCKNLGDTVIIEDVGAKDESLTPDNRPVKPSRGADTIKIKSSRSKCHSPCGVVFTAEGDNRLFKTYQWNFDDKGRFTNVDKDSNKAIGFHVGHVFNRAGTYTVSVNDGVDVGSTVVEVSEYAGKTYCVNCDSGQRVSSLREALQMVARAKTGRVLLVDGSTHNISQTIVINRSNGVVIGSLGQATVNITAPIEAAIRLSRSSNVTVYGINFVGNYDPVTGKGSTWSTDGVSSFNTSDVTVYRNSFRGINKGVFTTSGLNTVIIDNQSTDWHDYAVYSQHYDENKDGKLTDFEKGMGYIVAGNNFQQNPRAVSGSGGKRGNEPRWADHSAFRQQWSANSGIHQNILTSTTGWSSDGKGHNPPLRFHQGGDSGFSGSITENEINGGFVILSAATMNRQTIAGKGELLIEKNTLRSSSNTIYGLRLSYSESMVRDNSFINSTESKSQLLPFHYFVELDYGTLTKENAEGKKFFSGNIFKLNLPSVPVPFKDFGESYDKTNGKGLESLITQ